MDLAKLIDDAKRGDRQAYDKLLEANRPALAEAAGRLGGRLPEGITAADLVREAGERGWLRVRQIGSPASVPSWLGAIMEVLVYKAVRTGSLTRVVPPKPPSDGAVPRRRGRPPKPRPDATALEQARLMRGRPRDGQFELALAVRAVLDSYLTDPERAQLSESDRQNLKIHFLDNVPFAEQGRRDGTSAATARANCERALGRLVAVVLDREVRMFAERSAPPADVTAGK